MKHRRAGSVHASSAGLVIATALLSSVVLVEARDLSFEQRVEAQKAIEGVYYSHLIGTTKPFEEAVSRELLERKVRTYLKESVALERFWSTPVTGRMLQAEMDRMSRETRMPERLREIHAALRDDSFLIQECLARPALVHRLVRNFFSFDQTLHADARAEMERVREGLLKGPMDRWSRYPGREVLDLIAKANPADPVASSHDAPGRLELSTEEFEAWARRAPERVGEIGPVVEEPERFVIRIPLEKRPGAMRLAIIQVRKKSLEEWWRANEDALEEWNVRPVASTEGPAPVLGSAACTEDDTWTTGGMNGLPFAPGVWTGSLILTWGRGQIWPLSEGGRYDPATDTWSTFSLVNAPSVRSNHTVVWTGSRMVVWGGVSGGSTSLNTGGRYDPVTDTWAPTSIFNAPSGRYGHSAIWTGSRMIVWGGFSVSTFVNTGGRYDPESDSWTPVSTTNAPAARGSHTAVWTGSKMIVWGGSIGYGKPHFNTGGRYDPSTNTWTETTQLNAPSPREHHEAIWTGSRMIVWGGAVDSAYFNSGGSYDPAGDTWTATSQVGAPFPQAGTTAVWTGSLMLVWGGYSQRSGGIYDPASDGWLPISTLNAPPTGSVLWSAWTGGLMLVWVESRVSGGSYALVGAGSRYDPLTDSWTPMSSPENPPEARSLHTAVWTGNVMVVWGGVSGSAAPLGTGALYDPATSAWTTISSLGAPAPRYAHSAVWTGRHMVVWGGWDGAAPLATGGRYDPMSDSWTLTSSANSPSARSYHTAVWTGALMVVWGGRTVEFGTYFDTGGRYDPETDTWSPTAPSGAPAARSNHSALWTGSRMLVWGGYDRISYFNTGGLYDPETDAWAPTSTANSPSGRIYHAVIWSGQEMVVWGGESGPSSPLGSGGRFDPANDTWTPTSTEGAPSVRSGPSAVWTGRVMVVWGGTGDPPFMNTGGRYDPETDAWTPTSTANAPTGRIRHTAVWTGDSMLAWGGYGSGGFGGGLYCSCNTLRYYRDADGDGFGDPADFADSCTQPAGFVGNAGDCNDGNAAIHPGAVEVCNLIDDDCDGAIDEGVCDQSATDIFISFTREFGRGSGVVTWRTTHEVDVLGFNVVVITPQGERIQQNDTLINCDPCRTSLGADYAFVVPKHKSGHNIFIEVLHMDGSVGTFGPAIRL